MISVIFPTRKRPNSVRRVKDSIQNTASGQVEIVVYADADDDSPKVDGVSYITGPRIVLTECYNVCYERTAGDTIMFCSDDVLFRTPGWDDLVNAAFPEDRVAFVHGDDGYNGDRFGTHGFLSRKWIDTLGYVLPPYFSADYADNWINEVANEVHRRVYVPALFEHMHPSLGKGEVDDTFRETRFRGYNDNVAQLYRDTAHLRDLDIRKLQNRKEQ